MIIPDWPAPTNIKAISTTRQNGFSLAPYDSLNLGDHVGDDSDTVIKNRDYLTTMLALTEPPRWLQQVHGTEVSRSELWQLGDEADAIVSHHPNHVCAIMTADCLPILLCNRQGDKVAAIHAGWRGLAAGIIEKTLRHFDASPNDILVWLGPAIGPSQFEVGIEVYQTFTSHEIDAQLAFQQIDPQHFLADIYLLATQRFKAFGVNNIYGGEYCTVSEPSHFFSYRRDGITGRMASMIWIEHK